MELGICIGEPGSASAPKDGPPCYASVAGCPAVRYDSLSKLPKDILWVTNLRVEDLAEISSWRAFLRGADYLGINLKHICIDLEIGITSSAQITEISKLSTVLSGLYKKYLAPLELGLRNYPYNIHTAIKEQFFAELAVEVQNYDPRLAEWVNGCVQTTTECRHGTYSYGPRVCIRENAYKHASQVFDSPIASGRHAFFPAAKFGSTQDAVIQKIFEIDMFSICKLSRVRPKKGYSNIFGYGQMFANKTSASEQRSHACTYEIAFMHELFDFEIDEILLFESYNEERGSLASLVHGFDPLNSLGYAATLYYVNLIRARVDKWKSVPKAEEVSRFHGLRSAVSSMIYGVRDRMLTYTMAQQLANCDLSVHSYRNGYVFIDYDENKGPELLSLAQKNAWMFPA